MAVKRLKYQHLNEELMSKFTHELMILSRVRHRNVVHFIGAVVEQPNLCVVMEFMAAGALNGMALALSMPRCLLWLYLLCLLCLLYFLLTMAAGSLNGMALARSMPRCLLWLYLLCLLCLLYFLLTMAAGSLNDILHKQKISLSLPQTLHIATDVAQGCHYLHKQKPMIIHRDLKSQNVSIRVVSRVSILLSTAISRART